MVITILEAQVASNKVVILETAYQQAIKQLDAGIIQTFLVHDRKEPSVWRIITVWENQAALDAMRQSGETPRGVTIFRTADVEPVLSVLDVTAHASA